MDWLTGAFERYSVAWLLLSAFIGGVIGASVRFFFEDVLRPWLGWRREAKRIVRRYTVPLVRAADSLERRVNIMIRNETQRWFTNDEYFRFSTLYQFGEFLGWVRILEREIGFLPFESTRRGKDFQRRLFGIFRALCSHAYFRKWDTIGPTVTEVESSLIPRLMLSAIGEGMTREGQRREVIEFTEFLAAYADDARFRRSFQELETFLDEAYRSDPLRWDRLIACGANLRAFVRFLDPAGAMARRRDVANLEQIAHPEVAKQLHGELRDFAPPK